MIANRRDPAFIGALVYFDKAAELLSFARAAEHFGVTPSAVSHRIGALEAALGKRLFERESRRIRLTPEGSELANVTAKVLQQIESIANDLTGRQILRVSVGPFLSSTWLMPHLAQFEAQNNGMRVDLVHVIGNPNLRDVDVAILWENVDPCPPGHAELFDATSIPLIAPQCKNEMPFWKTAMLPIHYRDRGPWRHWLRAAGAPVAFAERGEVLHDPNLILKAAAHGRGIALGFLPFVDTLIADGQLIVASDIEVPAQHTYRVTLRDSANSLAKNFIGWLHDQAALISGQHK